MRTAKQKTPTNADRKALKKIAEAGFIGLSADGEPFLESNQTIGAVRLQRLIDLGLVEPNGDALIEGVHSQTYRPK